MLIALMVAALAVIMEVVESEKGPVSPLLPNSYHANGPPPTKINMPIPDMHVVE